MTLRTVVKVRELGRVITGKTPPTKRTEFFGTEFPFITPTDIPTFDVRYIRATVRGLSSSGRNFQHRYLLPKDAVCYVCIGSTVGKMCMTSSPSFTNQQINSIVVDTERYDPLYVFYNLRVATPRVQSIAQGSGAGKFILNKSSFQDLEVAVVPLALQRKIAAILSAYDDLIENNGRRIRILEEMARLIYDEWFVKFRFPGHEKVKMVDSGLGPIPQGWEAGTLDDVLSELESGSRPRGGAEQKNKDGVPSIGAENIIGLGAYDYSKEKYVSRDFFGGMRRGHVRQGDVLLYKDGALIGRKSMFRDSFPHAECVINEHVFILRTNERCTQNYLFFWLDEPKMTQNIRNLNTNAAQPGINQSGVRGLPITIPPRAVLDAFENLVEPMLAQLFNLAKKIAFFGRPVTFFSRSLSPANWTWRTSI